MVKKGTRCRGTRDGSDQRRVAAVSPVDGRDGGAYGTKRWDYTARLSIAARLQAFLTAFYE